MYAFAPQVFSAILVGTTTTMFQSGADLLNRCSGTAGNMPACIGYIQGVADAFMYTLTVVADRKCIPENVDTRQIRDVVLSYLQNHPAHRHEAAASLAISAFVEAWHCKPPQSD